MTQSSRLEILKDMPNFNLMISQSSGVQYMHKYFQDWEPTYCILVPISV